ncbi:hypothetical protein A3Q56_06229 [Intoshia linei]|uniref:Uncharacterized protein n=1 Tax=Intoshia linei TaxID=1819745 RepID=A0A177AW11_9BILA|nr:hypothetical protein A3Q56_06229 [Intoshia linei]
MVVILNISCTLNNFNFLTFSTTTLDKYPNNFIIEQIIYLCHKESKENANFYVELSIIGEGNDYIYKCVDEETRLKSIELAKVSTEENDESETD